MANPAHPEEPAGASSTVQPLSDLRVLDLTLARAGPTAVRQLADWGADVIRIEPPSSDDIAASRRDGSDFQNLHRNKRFLTLDLKTPEGREIFTRLAATADVVVENFRPQVKARLGLDYETLRAIDPRIILASISGFGQTGPYRERGGVDQIAQGMAGLMSVTGKPGEGPLRVGTAISDLAAGLYLAFGILAALRERDRSGEGQWVHTSLLEAMIGMLDFQAARWLVEGDLPRQQGNHHPTLSPMGCFETSDGWLNLAATSDRQFEALCGVLERPDLASDERFADLGLRRDNRKDLEAEIATVLLRHSTHEWVAQLNAVGIPSGPVNTIAQAFADPQVDHLGIATPVDHPTLGRIELVGQPVHLERTPSSLRRSARERGADTDEVLAELGYDEATRRDLRRRGIL